MQRDQLLAAESQRERVAAESLPERQSSWRDSTAYQATMALSSMGAMGVSYAKNRSIGWALLHGLLGPVYLAYAGYEAYAGSAGVEPEPARRDGRR